MVVTKLNGCDEVVRRKACRNDVSTRIRKKPIEIRIEMSTTSATRCVQVMVSS